MFTSAKFRWLLAGTSVLSLAAVLAYYYADQSLVDFMALSPAQDTARPDASSDSISAVEPARPQVEPAQTDEHAQVSPVNNAETAQPVPPAALGADSATRRTNDAVARKLQAFFDKKAHTGMTVKVKQTNNNTANHIPENFVNSGDKVRFHYKMYSQSTGKLVEQSPEKGMVVKAGNGIEPLNPNPQDQLLAKVPAALAEALAQSYAGDEMDVVFPPGMQDLPPQFSPKDAYVLKVRIEGVEPQSTAAPVMPQQNAASHQ